MLKKYIKIFAIVFIVIFILNVLYYYKNKDNVALIKIYGIINAGSAQNYLKAIREATNNDVYKAVFIKINSPGGSANASEKLFIAIKKANKVKPVVVLIEGLGASGAYYAACGARTIVAYPTSVIGSIGVIFESLNVSKLARKIGVSSFVIKSGEVKDAGNPFREPTKADVQMLQRVVNGVYNEFLNDVAESRNIDLNVLKRYADGSVFSARDALSIGLIDKVGFEDTAKNIIKKEAHIDYVHTYEMKENRNIMRYIFGNNILFGLDYIKLRFTPVVKTIFYD